MQNNHIKNDFKEFFTKISEIKPVLDGAFYITKNNQSKSIKKH